MDELLAERPATRYSITILRTANASGPSRPKLVYNSTATASIRANNIAPGAPTGKTAASPIIAESEPKNSYLWTVRSSYKSGHTGSERLEAPGNNTNSVERSPYYTKESNVWIPNLPIADRAPGRTRNRTAVRKSLETANMGDATKSRRGPDVSKLLSTAGSSKATLTTERTVLESIRR